MKSRIKTLIIVAALFATWAGFSSVQAVQDGPTRWRFEESGALRCDLDGHDPFGNARPIDFVTHGRRVILHLRLPVDDGNTPYMEGPQVQWPIFKRGVRDKSLVIPGPKTRATDLPAMRVNDQAYTPAKRETYRYDGFFSIEYASQQGIQATRSYFPSLDHRMALQSWRLKNVGFDPATVQVPATLETLWKRQGADNRDWLVDYVVTGVSRQVLNPGDTVTFAVAYTAHLESEGPLQIDLAAEEKAFGSLIDYARGNLILETPDSLIDRAFGLAKIRILLSNIETKAGVLNTTGSMAYYCGFWANDNAEYTSPLVPLLGHADLLAGLDTMYRVWLKDIQTYSLKDKQITGSFESYNLMPYQRGRGDEAMVLYGLSYYLLFLGDQTRADEMWPLIERCLDYLDMNRNEAGVIASRTDELEGRLPTGKANLSTSALGYGGLNIAARLASSLGKHKEAQRCARFAESLDRAIESYFGQSVEGYDTYQYYTGGKLLRGWISLPLVVGIERRQDQTLKALFSSKLWLETPDTQEVNLKAVSAETTTRWARETYYALLAAFKGGHTELALEKTKTVLRSHVLGAGGPFADEDSIDLLSPTILYARVITEGLFGLEPLSFGSLRCRPRLPKSWPYMRLKHVWLLGRCFDVEVQRSEGQIQVRVLEDGKALYTQTGPEGTVFDIPL